MSPIVLRENDVEKYLFENLSELGHHKKYSKNSRQKELECGTLDILAKNSIDNPVVIEIKIGQAEHAALGQILAYMAGVENELIDKSVSGIIIAESFSPKLKIAVSRLRDIELYQFEPNFSFEHKEIE